MLILMTLVIVIIMLIVIVIVIILTIIMICQTSDGVDSMSVHPGGSQGRAVKGVGLHDII